MFRWGTNSHISVTAIESLKLNGRIITVKFIDRMERSLRCEDHEQAKDTYKSMIDQINNSTVDGNQLKDQIQMLITRINQQQEEIDWIKQALLYAPGGPVSQVGKKNFEARSKT